MHRCEHQKSIPKVQNISEYYLIEHRTNCQCYFDQLSLSTASHNIFLGDKGTRKAWRGPKHIFCWRSLSCRLLSDGEQLGQGVQFVPWLRHLHVVDRVDPWRMLFLPWNNLWFRTRKLVLTAPKHSNKWRKLLQKEDSQKHTKTKHFNAFGMWWLCLGQFSGWLSCLLQSYRATELQSYRATELWANIFVIICHLFAKPHATSLAHTGLCWLVADVDIHHDCDLKTLRSNLTEGALLPVKMISDASVQPSGPRTPVRQQRQPLSAIPSFMIL